MTYSRLLSTVGCALFLSMTRCGATRLAAQKSPAAPIECILCDPDTGVKAVIEPPTVTHNVVPVYPKNARQAGMEGRVIVRILVN
ncbi:MAG: hypothetical protein QGH20_00675 [Candidatus Latescibacteria bacterium]|jgi:outer membrane biosynthesis protein TonB|nr:hypothetical protein [Candidatus Latescibacterota bacterium]